MFSIWFARWLPGPFRHRCCRWKQHLKISNGVLTFTISKCLHNWPWKHPNNWHMMISKRLIVAAKCFQFVFPGFFRFPGPRASARFQSSICRTNWDARHHATNIWTLSCQAGKILKYYSIPKNGLPPRRWEQNVAAIFWKCHTDCLQLFLWIAQRPAATGRDGGDTSVKVFQSTRNSSVRVTVK